ncbi:hypothetical protein [Longimycelium tulufanense]|uniref:hypothetical protein n=1 Tax=Longimycelium tulufanense TaxID=907463 RepID=UPI0016657A27|nr:hypothetical protein [Longimycelium tulufanense]
MRTKAKEHAKKKRREAWASTGGALCLVCEKPIAARASKANVHPKCARNASWLC